MFSHLKPGECITYSVVDGDVVDVVEVRHVKRISLATLLSTIRREQSPAIITGGLPQRCRWYGRNNQHQIFVFEMPPRKVTWRYQVHLDDRQAVAIPVALPYQIYLVRLTSDGVYQEAEVYWSARPLPVGDAVMAAELLQYAGTNISVGTGNFCLGAGGAGQLARLIGPEAVLIELHRGLGDDLGNEHMSGIEIYKFMPPAVAAMTITDEDRAAGTLFGLPVDDWSHRHACMQYGLRLGLWTRAQTDPLNAVCDLPWPKLGTLHKQLSRFAPGFQL